MNPMQGVWRQNVLHGPIMKHGLSTLTFTPSAYYQRETSNMFAWKGITITE